MSEASAVDLTIQQLSPLDEFRSSTPTQSNPRVVYGDERSIITLLPVYPAAEPNSYPREHHRPPAWRHRLPAGHEAVDQLRQVRGTEYRINANVGAQASVPAPQLKLTASAIQPLYRVGPFQQGRPPPHRSSGFSSSARAMAAIISSRISRM